MENEATVEVAALTDLDLEKQYAMQVETFQGYIGSAYRDLTFATFAARPDLSPSQVVALDQVEKWSTPAGRVKSPFILLFGATGSGKTGLAGASAMTIARQGVGGLMWKTEVSLAARWRASHSCYDKDYDGVDTPDSVISECSTYPIVFIDDLGKSKVSEGWASALFEIIDARSRNNLPTLITSNCSPQALLQKYDVSLVDRLLGGVVCEVTGQSMRQSVVL